MKTTIHFLLLTTITSSPLLLAGCMSQEDRTARVERRQDRIDARTEGRQERWKIRADREDARAQAAFDSW
jgi:outer membrane murein-binding lipoprotein Lpp